MIGNKKNWPGLTRVWPGGPGPGLIRRVDRVSPGQFPSGFLPPPGPVPGPGRPGPGSTRRAGPGFKTLTKRFVHLWSQVRALWLLIWYPLEAYMVVNFKVRGISWGARKLTRTPTLIKNKVNL